ncbi:MAG: FAD-dependent oxidoreductase [Isosphaeraceae bacterium]
MKIVIVGGVAGGASAAARARRLSEGAEIVLFERGPEVSFANCGLPYYVGGEIAERNKLLIVTPQRLRERFRLDVRVRTSVEAIDRASKTVLVRDLETGREYSEGYDKLILSPGASPLRPPIPGVDLAGIFTLRDLRDADRIKAVTDRGVRQAVVIGGGYIGLEMVENLVRLNIRTTLVQAMDQLLGTFDREMTTPIEAHLAERGVEVLLNETAAGFSASRDGLDVQLASGRSLTAQLVVMGIGVKPENSLAVTAGLSVGERGGIRVNPNLQTDDPDIYAVGDAIEIEDFVLGGAAQIPLAGPANRQGRLAVNHILALNRRDIGGLGVRRDPRRLRQDRRHDGCLQTIASAAGTAVPQDLRHPDPQPAGYPGARPFSLKVLFDPEDRQVLS